MNDTLIDKCQELLEAYKKGELGQTVMPEESHPSFSKMKNEQRLAYFTLPMALNYQRDSYKMWQSALATFNDPKTKWVFDIRKAASCKTEELAGSLLTHKLAMQPNKHTQTWKTICTTITENFGSIEGLIEKSNNDYLILKENVQEKFKKEFPYLSGPKIFNYWSFIIQGYGGAKLANSEFIEIAPDTHVTQCSIKLGVITQEEAEEFTREKISERWRNRLSGSTITPIQMHPPLWFWSRNNFTYKLKE